MVLALALLLCLTPGLSGQRTAADWKAAGWEALRNGRAEEAALDFAEALRVNARDPIALLGAGASARLRGRDEEAQQHLAGALRINPAMTEASLLLGEMLYSRADLQGAIEVFRAAQVHAPSNPRIAARLEAWQREAALHDQFSQKVASHFTILFEGPPDAPVAARVADLLEAAYWRIGSVLGAYPSGPVTVVLYTQEQFRDVTMSPSWAGGAYDGRIRMPVAGKIDDANLERVLAHELTHAIVHSVTAKRIPQWLNEGLAQLFEAGNIDRQQRILQSKAPVPLSRLDASFEGLSTEQAQVAYAESAVAVKKLIDLGGPTAIYNLLTNVANDMPFAEAFERALLMPYSQFLASWAEK